MTTITDRVPDLAGLLDSLSADERREIEAIAPAPS